jgi:SAM-dependent methyltransferase
MATVTEHYDDHLGSIYSWMVGDIDATMGRNRADLEARGLRPGATGVAVDLGAGPGVHAIPLAQLGFRVIAIDTCAELNGELRMRAGALPVRVVDDDLLNFRAHCPQGADVILCMGDTLTHLASPAQVAALLADVVEALAPGGVFIATFRDYVSHELVGSDRFILVRGDEERILTCFLEYGSERITVHDVVHERDTDGWRMRVSSYAKLRLDPRTVAGQLGDAGLTVTTDPAPGGMLRVVAKRD